MKSKPKDISFHYTNNQMAKDLSNIVCGGIKHEQDRREDTNDNHGRSKSRI
jgi:hypothetical protein